LIGARQKSGFPEATLQLLKTFLDEKRNDNYLVFVHMLMVEARRIDPVSCGMIQEEAFCSRIHRLLRRWDIS
jgi:hypothetical protein